MKRPYLIKYRIYPKSKTETVIIEATYSGLAIKELRAAIGHECNIDKVQALEGPVSQLECQDTVSFINLYKRGV